MKAEKLELLERTKAEKRESVKRMKAEKAERKTKDKAAREEWQSRARADREMMKEEKINQSRGAIEAYWEKLEKMGIPRQENIDVEELHRLKLPRPSNYVHPKPEGDVVVRKPERFGRWKEKFIQNTPALLKDLRKTRPNVYEQLVERVRELFYLLAVRGVLHLYGRLKYCRLCGLTCEDLMPVTLFT